jgi:hypothetical protein
MFAGKALFPREVLEAAGGGAFIRTARLAAKAFANWQVRVCRAGCGCACVVVVESITQ